MRPPTSQVTRVRRYDACHCGDCPLAHDSEAINGSEALWRSGLAVIIQLEAGLSYLSFLALWTEGIKRQEECSVISHTGSHRLPGEMKLHFQQELLHVSSEDSFSLISHMRLMLPLARLSHMLIRCPSSWPISANILSQMCKIKVGTNGGK